MVKVKKKGIPLEFVKKKDFVEGEICADCDRPFGPSYRQRVTYVCDHVRCVECVDKKTCKMCDQGSCPVAGTPGPSSSSLSASNRNPEFLASLGKEEKVKITIQPPSSCSSWDDLDTLEVTLKKRETLVLPSADIPVGNDQQKLPYKCMFNKMQLRPRPWANDRYVGEAKPFSRVNPDNGIVTQQQLKMDETQEVSKEGPLSQKSADEAKVAPKPVARGRYQCSKCGKKFDLKHNFERHGIAQTCQFIDPTDPLKCNACHDDIPFSSKRSLRRHLKTHLLNPDPPKCSKCKRRFTRNDNMQAHRRNRVCSKRKKSRK